MGRERLQAAFGKAREESRAAFIPYITAGDPSLAGTGDLLDALARAGADAVELGVPFSDPVADGPVNQRAAERALAAGTTLAGILDLLAAKRAAGFSLPAVLFTYANPVWRLGWWDFASRAAKAGADGVLVVDLPVEEAAEPRAALAGAGLATVFLASPTTSEPRLAAAVANSSGFLYYVSRLGVTGASDQLAGGLDAELERVRRAAGALPVAVGFGISNARQAAWAARHADGVVVGSALVKLLEGPDARENQKRFEESAAALAAAMRRPPC